MWHALGDSILEAAFDSILKKAEDWIPWRHDTNVPNSTNASQTDEELIPESNKGALNTAISGKREPKGLWA